MNMDEDRLPAQPAPSSSRARELIAIYNSVSGPSLPRCNPHSLAAVVLALDEFMLRDEDGDITTFFCNLAAELRRESTDVTP